MLKTIYGNPIPYLIQSRLMYGGNGYYPGVYKYKLLNDLKIDSGLTIALTAHEAVKFAAINKLTIIKHRD